MEVYKIVSLFFGVSLFEFTEDKLLEKTILNYYILYEVICINTALDFIQNYNEFIKTTC